MNARIHATTRATASAEPAPAWAEAARVQQVIAHYVRATDARNPLAMARLFVGEGRLQIFHRKAGIPTLLMDLRGSDSIAGALTEWMRPHAARDWTHHTTHDWIIDVLDDQATIDAQFIAFESVGDREPAAGWPPRASGVQGSVRAVDAGYLRASLCRSAGAWKIETMRMVHDLPIVVCGLAPTTDR